MATKSSKAFRIVTYLSLVFAVFAAHTPRSSPATDPDVVQYLTEVFNGVKGSGRKPINEELNLLPDESEGFANMVRCFSADYIEYRSDEAGTTRARTNKLILNFHLYSLESTDRIVSVRVVLKHLASLPHFRATVYEMNNNGYLMKLDSQISDDGWVELKVQDMFELQKRDKTSSNNPDYKVPLDKEHRVVLELTELNSDLASEDLITILHSLNPFVAVYTYNTEVYEHLTGSPSGGRQTGESSSSHIGRTISKRQAAAQQAANPFAHLARDECQLHGVNITFQDLGWPSSTYEVILPNWLNYTFCYGRCDRPIDLGNSNKYTAHAKTLSLLKPDLARAGIAPCCAPKNTTSIQIIVLSGNVTETTTMPLVQSCICQ